MAVLECLYDYASPFSYLALSQLPGIAERTGASIRYQPVLLGALIVESKNTPPPAVPAKAAYMMKDIPRWIRRYGLEFAMNPHFPVSSVKVMRGAIVAQEMGAFDAYHAAMMRAMWVEGVDLANVEALQRAAEGAGLDGAKLVARIADQDVKDALKANTDDALARGAFGVPTFYVGDEMFFGNDRLDFVEEALA